MGDKSSSVIADRPVQEATLVFLTKGDSVLLAMKKRGFGEGLWNGVGGKIDPGETIEEAAIRETEEEINVRLTEFTESFQIFFDYSSGINEKDFKVHVFTATSWEGEPSESEEMRPQWFEFDAIPYEQMWDDDKYWLPKMLNGKTLAARVSFDKNNKVTSYEDWETSFER